METDGNKLIVLIICGKWRKNKNTQIYMHTKRTHFIYYFEESQHYMFGYLIATFHLVYLNSEFKLEMIVFRMFRVYANICTPIVRCYN